jgi:hypothetical protein
MMRYYQSMNTLTYAYGARAPIDREQRRWMFDELRRAGRYKNALVASHRAERERVIAARRDLVLSADEHWWIHSTREQYRAARRALRKASGLGWGTYQLVEQDIDAAIRSGGELRFKRYDGSGRVGAAIQACSRATTEKAAACIVAPPDTKRRTTATLTMRRGCVVALPIVLHRPLPPGRLLRAYVQVERIGTRWVWGLRVVVQPSEPKARRLGTGKCSVNFGWRVTGDGIRVAYAVGDHGTHELVLPRRLLDAYRHSEHLRAVGDARARGPPASPSRRRSSRRRAGRHGRTGGTGHCRTGTSTSGSATSGPR